MVVLAIDIGGTKHSLALFEDRRLIRWGTFPTNPRGCAWMVEHLKTLLPRWLEGVRPEACGIGFGGPVDYAAQRVGRSMHLGGWQDFPLAAVMAEHLGVPCRIDNDANLGGLGEWAAGAGQGAASLLYVTLSTGIGAGILIGGEIWHGADSLAGELGHVTIQTDGPECPCGQRGCFEALCSGRAIEARTGRRAAELLEDAAFRAEYVPNLARGLRVALLLVNPERVVIGGGLSKAGEVLFRELRGELERQIPASLPVRVEVRPAALGDFSVLWGAAVLAEA
jgi:glucokinase